MKHILLILLLLYASNAYAKGRWTRLWQHKSLSEQITQVKGMFWRGVTVVGVVGLSCLPLACSVPVQNSPTPIIMPDNLSFDGEALLDKNVHFRINGQSYRGHVKEHIAGENKLVIVPHYDSEKIVTLEDISGVRIEQHELLFGRVRAPAKWDELRYVEGKVTAVFTDGYAAVIVVYEVDHHHHKKKLEYTYEAFYPIRQLTLLQRTWPPSNTDQLVSH